MLELRSSRDRGSADYGWLRALYTFSFANYHDPKQQGFSDLLVINEDRIQAGMGFGTHPHEDMEIFTYVLEGAIAHKDSMGTGSVIYPGDVQMMSAGTGIRHSEFNHSSTEELHLLQIWIVPNRLRVEPRYQQVHFDPADKRGKLHLIISPEGENGSLSVYQDARVYAGNFEGSEQATLELGPDRYAYLQVARGSLEVNGTRLNAGDGARVRDEQVLHFGAGKDAEILVFDLRAHERPTM